MRTPAPLTPAEVRRLVAGLARGNLAPEQVVWDTFPLDQARSIVTLVLYEIDDLRAARAGRRARTRGR